ncbi:MAG: hypothetical protein HY537_02040 [Deltaproteobacteria bacterium]|nr:hypothetical protein [Deltaproteobacteria bacterium]
MVKKFEVLTGQTRTTRSGKKLTRVSPKELIALGVTDPLAFGEAWRDDSGMVWGDMVRENGLPRFMFIKDATAYCKHLGAQLPSAWPESRNSGHGNKDSDFVRLAKFLSDTLFSERMLPNFVYIEDGKAYARRFWSATPVDPRFGTDYYGYVFRGEAGYSIDALTDGFDGGIATRCVVAPR